MLKRTGFKPRTAPMGGNKGAALARVEKKEKAASSKAARGMKARQLAVKPEEKELWGRLAQLGCVACMKDGVYNPHVSIHHCDGRTKPDCHEKVLPLCASHHQDDGSGAIAIHPWKARFEKRYGTQAELMALCQELLKQGGRAPAATGTRPDQKIP